MNLINLLLSATSILAIDIAVNTIDMDLEYESEAIYYQVEEGDCYDLPEDWLMITLPQDLQIQFWKNKYCEGSFDSSIISRDEFQAWLGEENKDINSFEIIPYDYDLNNYTPTRFNLKQFRAKSVKSKANGSKNRF